MTVIGALSSFRELGEMSPHKRTCGHRTINVYWLARNGVLGSANGVPTVCKLSRHRITRRNALLSAS